MLGLSSDVSSPFDRNADGLERYLRSTGPDNYPTGFIHDFMRGFNSAPRGSFSAIDTGSTSQSADRALLRHLACFLPLFNAVLLGGTHDGASYVRYLASVPPGLRAKVHLLQTTPVMASELAAYYLPTHRFNGIFDGRNPNNGLRHGMHDWAAQYKARMDKLASIEAEVSCHTRDMSREVS